MKEHRDGGFHPEQGADRPAGAGTRFRRRRGTDVEIDAAPVCGGYRFIDYPVGKAMRDAMIMHLCEGAFQIRWLVKAREMLLLRLVDEPAVAA